MSISPMEAGLKELSPVPLADGDGRTANLPSASGTSRGGGPLSPPLSAETAMEPFPKMLGAFGHNFVQTAFR